MSRPWPSLTRPSATNDRGLPPEVVASAIDKLDTDDALYLIEDLDKAEQDEILAKVSQEDRVALNRALDYRENTAGRLMQTEFVAVPSSGLPAGRSSISGPRPNCPKISSRSMSSIRPITWSAPCR